MPTGISIQKISNIQKEKIDSITNKIRNYIAKFGLDDEEWAQAISSQYFLLCLSKQLKWKAIEYERLLNKCLSSFSVTYKGDYILDNDRLLITPDETSRIVACMQDEDASDPYYMQSAKMQAQNIDSQQMYLNFHYGLLIRIVSSEDTEVLRAIKHTCLDNLLSSKALDSSNGWYPYRVPWITARILISLKHVDCSSYSKKEMLSSAIRNALSSLYQRIDEKEPLWRSGVGEWVSKWESTALCLEALLVWDEIKNREDNIHRVLSFICSPDNRYCWLDHSLNFNSEDSANKALASVILASVVLRITRLYFTEIYNDIFQDIIVFLEKIIDLITKNTNKRVRQYCTIPQIFHYVLAAFE